MSESEQLEKQTSEDVQTIGSSTEPAATPPYKRLDLDEVLARIRKGEFTAHIAQKAGISKQALSERLRQQRAPQYLKAKINGSKRRSLAYTHKSSIKWERDYYWPKLLKLTPSASVMRLINTKLRLLLSNQPFKRDVIGKHKLIP